MFVYQEKTQNTPTGLRKPSVRSTDWKYSHRAVAATFSMSSCQIWSLDISVEGAASAQKADRTTQVTSYNGWLSATTGMRVKDVESLATKPPDNSKFEHERAKFMRAIVLWPVGSSWCTCCSVPPKSNGHFCVMGNPSANVATFSHRLLVYWRRIRKDPFPNLRSLAMIGSHRFPGPPQTIGSTYQTNGESFFRRCLKKGSLWGVGRPYWGTANKVLWF